MTIKVREYIDFWMVNSLHAREQYGSAGAEQSVAELVHRLTEGAKGQGITEKAMRDEVGDLKAYIRAKLGEVNEKEKDRPK